MESTFSAHYISGTHWDREWYRPVQEYRLLLVEIIDQLLEMMETSEEFRYFHLDGQTCVLADYIEVRPENRERLARLMRNGRILIGPWFTMPDLFCPGDEALVRNLLMGKRICQEWDVPAMPVAYTCDMFGHPSQMPQIYKGFALPHCVVGRGTNEHTTPAFFTWQAPDGSNVFTFKLQDIMGYGAFSGARSALDSIDKNGNIDPQAEAKARESLSSYIKDEISRTNGDALCLIDALDHQPPATNVKQLVKLIHEELPNVSVCHSTLPAFFADAEATATDIPVKKGELREPSKIRAGYLWLIPNCVSARVKMKQANDNCQTLLERWVEPFLALANMQSAAIPARFLRLAWENVLLNHAHDSICGCSIDQVHRDMMYRFDQARILGQQLRAKSFGALTSQFADLAKEKDEFTITIANSLPVARREVVAFSVDLPKDYPHAFSEGFNAQWMKSFTLHDVAGNEVPYQRLGIIPNISERSQFALAGVVHHGPAVFTRYQVAAEVALPALGFTSLLVKSCPTPIRRMGTLRTGPAVAENEYLQIAIACNGTLQLTDRLTGATYSDLLMLEDRSEIGDGWFHGETVTDEIIVSSTASAQLAVLHDGPEQVTFAVTVRLSVPHRYDSRTEKRSNERVELPVTHNITLRRGAKVVDVETIIENTAEDHRLRLLLPTDAVEATTYLAHHPFDLVERAIALDMETETWQEAEIAEKPFLGMQAVGSANRGLAFLAAAGMHEGGVVDDLRRTMQVTLFRSFRNTVGTLGEVDGLELGTIKLKYALMPYAGELPRVAALMQLQALQAGVLTRQTGCLDSGYPALQGTAAPVKSYLEQLDKTLVVSTIKAAEDGNGLIVRLWNPNGATASERLQCYGTIAAATAVTMAEDMPDASAQMSVAGDTVAVTVTPYHIVTLRIVLA